MRIGRWARRAVPLLAFLWAASAQAQEQTTRCVIFAKDEWYLECIAWEAAAGMNVVDVFDLEPWMEISLVREPGKIVLRAVADEWGHARFKRAFAAPTWVGLYTGEYSEAKCADAIEYWRNNK